MEDTQKIISKRIFTIGLNENLNETISKCFVKFTDYFKQNFQHIIR